MPRKKPGPKLTETDEKKRKKYARLLARGIAQKEAYIKVYGDEGKSPQTIQTSASYLAYRPDVKAQVQSFAARADKLADENALMSRMRRMKWLSDRIERCDTSEDKEVRTALLCIQELNKMEGAYEPDKMQVETSMSISNIVRSLQNTGCRPPVH